MDLEKEFIPGTTAQGLVRLPAAEACSRAHAVPTLPCPASAARMQGGSGWEVHSLYRFGLCIQGIEAMDRAEVTLLCAFGCLRPPLA